eukprot:c22770_g1_i1 orf=170-1603(+)
MASSEDQPSWFTPARILFVLCIVNLLNYVDRGVIASNGVNGTPRETTCTPQEVCEGGSGIQGEFGLNNFQDGVLSSVFLVGLLVSSPIFAYMAKTHNSFKLMGIGLSVWTFATAMCGFSFDFWSITAARVLVGVGEASFISLAAPFIVDNAPHDKKASWLAYFYMCIPVGMALGYVYGGLVGSFFTWRVAFWGEAVLMLPCAVIGFVSGFAQCKDSEKLIKDITDPTEEEESRSTGDAKPVMFVAKGLSMHAKAFCEDIKMLFQSRVYTLNVAGSVAYNAVLGAYSYWGPRAGYAIFNLTDADLVFGCMTVICGIFGTVAGGVIYDSVGATIPNGFKLLTIATFIGGAACFVSFLSETLFFFIPLFALGELFLFATQGPVNTLILDSAPEKLRPLATAVSTICIHVFGDVPSSPIVGAMQDYLNNWRLTTLLLTTVFFLAAFVWSLGIFIPATYKAQSYECADLETNQEKVLLLENN